LEVLGELADVTPAGVTGFITRRRLAIVAVVAGVLLVLLGIILWWIWGHSKPEARLPDPQPIISGSFPTPPSGPEYRVKVDELSIDLPVVEGDGWNVALFVAAHYPGMKQPGEGGRSLLYAHARAGMFGPLLRPGGKVGDHVEVFRPNRPTLRYVMTKIYPRWPSTDTSILKPNPTEQLVLLTCTSYNPNDPRVVVVATPL
jgi:LPXTG-site transpeptidase (sortase) family protein